MHILAILVVSGDHRGILPWDGALPRKGPPTVDGLPDKIQPHESMMRWVCGSCGEFRLQQRIRSAGSSANDTLKALSCRALP